MATGQRSAVVLVLMLLGAGCLPGPLDGGSGAQLDWFTSSCQELGGSPTAAGACYVGCKQDRDCPLDTLVCFGGSSSWITGVCMPKDAGARGCGPGGWLKISGLCYLSCSGTGRNTECPTGFSCIANSVGPGYFCTGQPSSGGTNACSACVDACAGISGCSCCHECGGTCFEP